jgi:hypothetical protein
MLTYKNSLAVFFVAGVAGGLATSISISQHEL